MSFYERYELLDLSRDGFLKTFAARQRSTGREVSVHLLIGGRAAHSELLEKISRMAEHARVEIVEAGEHEGTPYFVTAPWLRQEPFEQWAAAAGEPTFKADQFAKAGSWRVPTAEFERKSAPPSSEPGEFTKLFQAPRSPAATPPIPEPPPPTPDPRPEPPCPSPARL